MFQVLRGLKGGAGGKRLRESIETPTIMVKPEAVESDISEVRSAISATSIKYDTWLGKLSIENPKDQKHNSTNNFNYMQKS